MSPVLKLVSESETFEGKEGKDYMFEFECRNESWDILVYASMPVSVYDPSCVEALINFLVISSYYFESLASNSEVYIFDQDDSQE